MKRTLPLFVALFVIAGTTFAQSVVQNSIDSFVVSGELQSPIAVNKAKIGDEVVLKTTRSVEKDGRTCFAKGSKIIGQVIDVQNRTSAQGASSISLRFDRIEENGKVTQIKSFVGSIATLDGKLRSAESDHDQAVAAAAKTSNPYEQRTYATQQTPTSPGNPNSGQGNPTGYVRKAADPALPNSPRTLEDIYNVAGNSTEKVTEISIAQDSEGISTISNRNGALKLEKWTKFTIVIGK